MKKLVLVLLLVFALAIPALANPFVDVPLNHWAYDAVQTLAAKGVVIGYPDGTFGGQRTLTRYEFVEATARALAYVEQYGGIKEDVEILSRLAVEFADELANLGVRVADLEAALGEQSEAIAAMQELVDKHERFFDPVTITGKWTADYTKDIFPVGPATLEDTAELTFTAEVNPETVVSVTLAAENLISGVATNTTVSGYDLKYNGDWSLWISDEVEPATIGLGLIYDFDELEDFPGVWAQWNWNTDEDLGTWTAFMNVEDFYVLNVDFLLGDDDDIAMGVTASYDVAAGNVLVAGANLGFDLTDEGDEHQVSLALEGGVLTDMVGTSFGAAALMDGTFSDGDLGLTVEGWYTQPGFVPTNSAYDPDELGVEVGASFSLTDSDDDNVQVAVLPKWSYVMDSAMVAPVDHFVELKLEFTNIDSDHADSKAYVSGKYNLLTTDITLKGQYLNLYLGDADEFTFNVYGEYVVAAVPRYKAIANMVYEFENDPMVLIVEGRVDSGHAALFSAEAQLQYAMAENTDLKVGIEYNDWSDDINDWDDKFIVDDTTKVYAGIEVSF